MAKPKLELHNLQEIDKEKSIFVHQNAFIKPDGTFYLAKGYTGCNPSHQIESSALWIGRKEIGDDFVQKFKEYYDKLMWEKQSPKYLYYLRTILVHYYGYALFCRTEIIKSFKDRNRFYENSLVPDLELYGKEVTPEQIEVIRKLYEINDDGTLIQPLFPLENHVMEHGFEREAKTIDDVMSLVLENKHGGAKWHI